MIGEIQSGISHPVDPPGIETEPGEFWDDARGFPLKQELVEKARMEEMREFAKHGVYTKVPEADCWNATGKGPIGVIWVDINKGDEDRPEYRSRLVAKELKQDMREDLFAATPPLEA